MRTQPDDSLDSLTDGELANLDWLNLTDAELARVPCEETHRSPPRRQFLRGPLDWQDLCAVAQLPGRALEVWLLLHLRWPVKGVTGVTLPNQRLAEMGVDHLAKARALRTLESAGFIRVERQPGCSARITLTRPKSKRMEDRHGME